MKDAKPQRLIKALEKEGFVGKAGGKHFRMTKGDKSLGIPIHGIVKRNVVEAIRKQAGIDKKTFYEYNF